jgi:predicted PurR-regulated permease PerM
MKDELITESWRAGRSPLRFWAIFLGLVVLLLFLWAARSIFVITFFGLLFGVSIMPAVDWLQRFRVPRGAGAAAVVLVLIAILAGIGALMAPVLQKQAVELRQRMPEAIDRVDAELTRRHLALSAWPGEVKPSPKPSQGAPKSTPKGSGQGPAGADPLHVILTQQLSSLIPYLFPFFSTTISALTGVLLVIFLAIFFAADPTTYSRGVLHLVPGRHRPRAREVLRTLGHTLRGWVVARSIAMVTIGIVVSLAMALLGVRAAVALGVIAGVLEFVPVFGPILGAIPAIALAFADSPQKALWVAITFVVIQQLEGNVLIPILLQKTVEVPPALSLIGIASMAIVLGVLGVFIAEPLVAAALVIVKMVYVEPAEAAVSADA